MLAVGCCSDVTVLQATEIDRAGIGRTPPSGSESAAIGGAIAKGDATRRMVDMLVALGGLVLLAPLLALAAILIVLDSSGGALYRQERVGRFGRPFRLVKLRTMIDDAEADGAPVWAQDPDPRVTRIGALLRRSHLDEVPQLWNVLRGEMSLIGPRPERPEFVALLASAEPTYSARHAVRPGITGWAQVQFGYGASIDDAVTKLQYDLHYIRHRSLRLDVLIVLKTLPIVLRLEGT